MAKLIFSAVAVIAALILADNIGGAASPLLLLGSAGLLTAVYLVWTVGGTKPKNNH